MEVALTQRSERALSIAARITGDSQVDTVNRALQMYAYIIQEQQHGGEIVLRGNNGETSVLKFD